MCSTDKHSCNRHRLVEDLHRVSAGVLNKIQKWADENGFKFSQTKTVCMHFCNLMKLHHEPTLTLNGLAIPVVQEHKFLYLTTSCHLYPISNI